MVTKEQQETRYFEFAVVGSGKRLFLMRGDLAAEASGRTARVERRSDNGAAQGAAQEWVTSGWGHIEFRALTPEEARKHAETEVATKFGKQLRLIRVW